MREPPLPFTRDLEPSAYLDTPVSTSGEGSPLIFQKRHSLEIAVFCGSPGSGKSSFYWKHLQPLGYQRVNQDILKTVSLYQPSFISA